MYQFFSSLPEKEINRRYLKKFNLNIINKKFDAALRKIPELEGFFPDNFKGSDLLILDFYKLTAIYYGYMERLETCNDARKEEINKILSSVFNYDTHSGKIKDFLCNPDNGYETYNCVYCDIQHFQRYKEKGILKIKFHADHVLDKGKCPLVGISIHNFVPSCDVCNEGGHKGTQTLGRTKKETLKISPKSRFNNFEKDVEFYFVPSCDDIKDLRMFKGDEGWEIDFRYNIPEYARTIAVFNLKERYNAEKRYFGDYIFKRKCNPDNKIKEDARLFRRSFGKIVEDLFEFEKKRRHHESKEKCRKDLIKQVFGKLPSG